MKKFKTLIELFEYSARPDMANPDDFTSPEQIISATLAAEERGSAFFSPAGRRPESLEEAFTKHRFADLFERAGQIAAGLVVLGTQVGDRIGLFSDNRVEWLLADMATILAGCLDVPRGCDSTAEELAYILEHSGCRFCFVENQAMLQKILSVLESTKLQTIIVLEDPPTASNRQNQTGVQILGLAELTELGSQHPDARQEVRARSKAVTAEDSFTIIYTSGTTGRPKGVELTHANMIYNVNEVPGMLAVRNGERCLSLLPIWHVFERALEYCLLPYESEIYYTSTRDLRRDFGLVRPTFMASAPRLWESIYDGLMAKLEGTEPAKRKMFDLAVRFNERLQTSFDYLLGNELGNLPGDDPQRQLREVLHGARDALPAIALDQLVFRKIRAALGGRLRGTISGGGALPAHVDRFFNLIGIPVYEGYGMTECSPIISVRSRGHVVQGSVGFCPPGTTVQVRREDQSEADIGETGVIYVRGPQVMKGYYKDPQATAAVLKDGWLCTGDLGFVSRNGTLSIRGRAKDTIVLLGGENVEPEPIENRLRQNNRISQVVVVGQDRKTLAALIWPNLEQLHKEGLIPSTEATDLNSNDQLRSVFSTLIKETVSATNGFKAFERVTGFAFLPKALEVGDELTNLFKLKRNRIAEKYATLIDGIYQTRGAPAARGK